MKRLLAFAALTVAPALAGCGDAPMTATAIPSKLTPAQQQPAPAVAAGMLASIDDGPDGERRIGYVNAAALDALSAPLSSSQLATTVLGTTGAQRLASRGQHAQTATQVGDATILGGTQRVVLGATGPRREQLAATTPATNLLSAETASAVQSCLGDPAAATIVGEAVLGYKASIGASVIDNADQPSGPKLMLCAAPHLHRQLAQVERRLRHRFPATGSPASRPVIGETEIGERAIISAAIALDTVDPQLLKELLEGGPALLALARG